MIQAIIDIGSNTVRMAIYIIEKNDMELLMKKKHMVGLAAYLDNNIMQQAGIDKVCQVLKEFKNFLDVFKIDRVEAFTTAALRNCKNSQEAVGEIINRTGINIRVISGDKEAEYDFVGAIRNVNIDKGMLVDIGGASTELVYFSKKRIISKISLPMGSLYFKSKYCSSIMPSKQEADFMRNEAKKLLEEAKEFSGLKVKSICGIGGTYKGGTALYNAMYGVEIKNREIKAEKISDMVDYFCQNQELSQEDAIMLMRYLPDRINTVIPGLIIADVISSQFSIENIIYSDSGVREGFIASEILKNWF